MLVTRIKIQTRAGAGKPYVYQIFLKESHGSFLFSVNSKPQYTTSFQSRTILGSPGLRTTSLPASPGCIDRSVTLTHSRDRHRPQSNGASCAGHCPPTTSTRSLARYVAPRWHPLHLTTTRIPSLAASAILYAGLPGWRRMGWYCSGMIADHI